MNVTSVKNGVNNSPNIFFIGDYMKEFLLDTIFMLKNIWYMCNVIQYSNNYKSLRRR